MKRGEHVNGNAGPEADLLGALARLQRGQPLHPDLIRAKKAGKLKINISTVAREAGRSRTLIGKLDCSYPDIRKQIIAYISTIRETTDEESNLTAQHIINNLRRENALLLQEKAILATRVQDFANVARDQHKRANAQAEKAQRSEKRIQALQGRTRIAGKNGNVLPFRDPD